MAGESVKVPIMRPSLKKAVAKLRLYRLASGLYELYRLVVKPHTHGALVAIWWDQRLLLVQCSYRSTLSLRGAASNAGRHHGKPRCGNWRRN